LKEKRKKSIKRTTETYLTLAKQRKEKDRANAVLHPKARDKIQIKNHEKG